LFQAFAEHDALDRLERPLALDLRIHLGGRIGTVYDAEQAEQVWGRVINPEDRTLRGRLDDRAFCRHSA
jgi:hypothetical protein